MEVKIGDSINYAQSVSRISKYKHSKILPVTGGQEVKILDTANVTSFELPVQTYNLSDSFFNFTMSLPPSGTDDVFTVIYRDIIPFERLELYTRGGVYLADITNCAHWGRIVLPRTKKVEDFLASYNDTLTPVSSDENAPATTNLANNADNIVQIQLSGREMLDCIFGLNKSIFIPEVVNLRITWLTRNSIGYEVDTTADPGDPTQWIYQDLTGELKVSDLSYYLAIEQNEMVEQDLKQQVMNEGGMQLMFPASFMYKNNLPAGAQHSITVRMGRGNGINFEKVTTLPINANESKNKRYNSALPSINSLYSLLNSQRQTEFDIDIQNKEDIAVQRSQIRDTVYGMYDNRDSYFSWCDNWCNNSQGCAVKQMSVGLSLNNEVKYDLYLSIGNDEVNYYTNVVTQRMMIITPQAVEVQ